MQEKDKKNIFTDKQTANKVPLLFLLHVKVHNGNATIAFLRYVNEQATSTVYI